MRERGRRAGWPNGRLALAPTNLTKAVIGSNDKVAILRDSPQRSGFSAQSPRVSAETKLELLGLIEQAVADGWAHAGACRALDLADVRAHRWRQRLRETGTLEDRDPGDGAVHGLLAWEAQAILDLIEQ